MVRYLKIAITLVLATMSAIWFLIALGKQAAWRPALATWECGGNPPPVPTGWHEAIAATAVSDWVFSLAFPIIFAALILCMTRFRVTLLFSVPSFALHMVNRWFALEAAVKPWGLLWAEKKCRRGYKRRRRAPAYCRDNWWDRIWYLSTEGFTQSKCD